jgi:hypothetical protein
MILIAKSSNQSFGAILKKTYYLLQKKTGSGVPGRYL